MWKPIIIALGATPEIQRYNQWQATRVMENGCHKIPQQCERVSNGVWVKSKNEWKNRKRRARGKILPGSINPTVSPAADPVWPLTIHCTALSVMGHGEYNLFINLILCILHCRSCRYNRCGAISVYLLLVAFPSKYMWFNCVCKLLIANVIHLKWINLREFEVYRLVFHISQIRLSCLMLFFPPSKTWVSSFQPVYNVVWPYVFNTLLSVHRPCCGSMKMQPVWCFQERETDIFTTFTSLMHEGSTKGAILLSQGLKRL